MIHAAIDVWAASQKSWIEQNIHHINKSKGRGHVEAALEAFQRELVQHVVATAVTREAEYAITTYSAIARMFGVTRVGSEHAVADLDLSGVENAMAEKILTGMVELFFHTVFFPLSIPLLLFRGAINRSDLRDAIDTAASELKARMEKQESVISSILDDALGR